MEDRGFKHRIVGSETTAVQDENGMWTVTANMYEKVSDDGKEWEEAELSIMFLDDDLDKGFSDVTVAIVNMFKAEILDKGYVSLVDAKRSLEKEKEDDPKDKNL